jgi:carbonic anhydrase/acetyltransferase-like protein (isoleucine patch superfamily)
MSLDTVQLDPGATLGPNSVILPASTLGENATVGATSLVMRGEFVPAHTYFSGNPVIPWVDAPELPSLSEEGRGRQGPVEVGRNEVGCEDAGPDGARSSRSHA